MTKKYRREKMGKKYLDTKEGSLEQSVLGVWQTAIEEGDARMDGRTKGYKEHRAKLEAARVRRENKKNLNKEEVKVDEGDKEEYTKFFNAALKKFGVDSPADFKSDEEKKKFFDYVDKNYKGDHEEEVKKLHKELFGEVKESYEIGTDEYRKHTEDVTPGQDGEWVEAVNAKNISMREALAKVWSVDEGKSPFKKEDKKGDKTLTGKKIASVDVNPTIKEKAK